MRYTNIFFALVTFFLGISSAVFAQQKEDLFSSEFNKYEAFSPLFMNQHTGAFHSATGNPGPIYWQNRADYQIKATLDTAQQELKGKVTITYTNNSPYSLDFLWLQLDQNTFRKEARSAALFPDNGRNGVANHTKGYQIKSVTVEGEKANFVITDTRMQIRLSEPLEAEGGEMEISIHYSFAIPFHGKDRMGRVKTKNGWIYTLAQWYPRMAVFDEAEGWNNLPYLGAGEFYLEYGTFDYEVTVPDNMIVTGSGVLQNPKEVLTKEQISRLNIAKNSDTTVTILSKKEMLEGTHHLQGKEGMLTWRFHIENSRDVAWAASSAFIWDAARINLPEDKTALAQSVYPEENSGRDGYGRSTEYTKRCLEIYSQKWFPYPYKVATNVGAHELGMEYPGIVFCSYKSKGERLWGVVNHEFGHTWFPMIVGSNERKYGWMDEGLNTFINDLATEKFNGGEYFQPSNFQSMGGYLFDKKLDPVFTRPDVIHNQHNLGVEAYYKPSTALHVLRNVVLGPKRFDYAFQTYINRWKYKHPQPWDFFNTMSNASGEDLSWFFKGWIMKNWSNDQAVKGYKYNNGNPEEGAKITLMNYGKMPMPVRLKINFVNHQSKTVKLPVAIWMTGSEYIYSLDSKTKIASVEINPNHLVPDENVLNNQSLQLEATPDNITADTVIAKYIAAIGGMAALDSIQDYVIQRKAKFRGIDVTLTKKVKGADKYLRNIEVLGNSLMKIVINGDSVTVFARGEKRDIPKEAQKQLKEQQDLLFPEKNYAKEGYQLNLLGLAILDTLKVYVIQVIHPDGEIQRNYYAQKSGYKVQAKDQSGSLTLFSNYMEYDGIFLPSIISSQMLGERADLSILKATFNSGIKEEVFE